jgi:hypothetical protein
MNGQDYFEDAGSWWFLRDRRRSPLWFGGEEVASGGATGRTDSGDETALLNLERREQRERGDCSRGLCRPP